MSTPETQTEQDDYALYAPRAKAIAEGFAKLAKYCPKIVVQLDGMLQGELGDFSSTARSYYPNTTRFGRRRFLISTVSSASFAYG